jgi:hypothetical protein
MALLIESRMGPISGGSATTTTTIAIDIGFARVVALETSPSSLLKNSGFG